MLLIAGENAHPLYFSEDAYAAEPKELMIIPGADHVVYDQMDIIPFDRLADFFASNLA